ncbi:MAG: bifunctional DNA primase/polymerase [Thermoleophilaceae bacterium]
MSAAPSVERTTRFVEHAYRYAELGWALVRCDGKKPKGEGWQHTQPEPPDLVAGKWSEWGRRWNVGVVCGPSGLAIVDVDRDDSEAAVRELLGDLPRTPTVRTGRGRLQVYFRDPGGLEKVVRDGLELRVGGHQCVAPPSVHPDTGREYVWLPGLEPWTVALAALPAAVVDFFAEARGPNGRAAPIGEVIPIGAIDRTLASLAGSMRRCGADEQAIYAALVEMLKRCESGHTHTERDCRRIARSVSRYQPGTSPGQDGRSVALLREAPPVSQTGDEIDLEGAPAEELVLSIVTLDEFVAVEEEGASALVGTDDEALIPEGGDVMVYGDGGAGKTTLAIDLACHLAAGDQWVGLPVARPVRVLVIENEGPRPLFRVKLRRKREAWNGSPLGDRVHVWENPWARFTFDDEKHQQILAERIAELDVDVVMVGPVSRSGMNEAGTLQEVRNFLNLVGRVRRLSGRRVTFVLVHHENKGGQVSGAWEGAGDTLLHVTGMGHGRTRVHVQKARWASEYHASSLQLVWTDGEGFEIEKSSELDDDTLAEQILAAVSDNPGTAWGAVTRATKGVRDERRTVVRDRLLAGGVLVNIAKQDGADVALAYCPERKPARLYRADDPSIAHLLPARDAAGTQIASARGAGSPASSASCVPPLKDAGRRDADAHPHDEATGTAFDVADAGDTTGPDPEELAWA